MRRVKRQLGSELRTASSAADKVRLQWQETAIRRRRTQLLTDAFVAWVYMNWSKNADAAELEMALAEANSRAAAAQEQTTEALQRQSAEHASELVAVEEQDPMASANQSAECTLQLAVAG